LPRFNGKTSGRSSQKDSIILSEIKAIEAKDLRTVKDGKGNDRIAAKDQKRVTKIY